LNLNPDEYIFQISRISIEDRMKRIVIIGDIVNSKSISERAKIQETINNLFKKLNSDKSVISPYTITLGDEFQAVYSKADSIFNHIWQISSGVFPLRIRFSIGIGEITTKINKKQAIGMDGPAFHNARDGLNSLKENGCLLSVTDNLGSEEIIKQSLFLVSHHLKSWKKTRLNITSMLYNNYTAAEIAGKLNITDKAVYKNIDSGALRIIIDLTREITNHINQSLE
jgi:predicted DNA-binding protein YlxM (UPF0122 family)